MKKSILTFLFIFFVPLVALASWNLDLSEIGKTMDGHIFKWKIVCTSDGNALSATDLIPLMDDALKREVQRSMQMILDVQPGTGGVAPDATFDITLLNEQSIQVFSESSISNVVDTAGIQLSQNWNQFLAVFDSFYLSITDIGTSGDQITLYFTAWIE